MFPLNLEAGDLYVLYTYVLVLTEHLLDRSDYSSSSERFELLETDRRWRSLVARFCGTSLRM